jgi:hypothetical protein
VKEQAHQENPSPNWTRAGCLDSKERKHQTVEAERRRTPKQIQKNRIWDGEPKLEPEATTTTTATGKATPDGKRGGAAVRGKCTTRLDVYILKENCLDQREERKAVALFLCRRREKVYLVLS